jgi:DMSO/TMAO reductase YedYZ molybdopterin-dependent catalytic subunit
VKSWKLKVEGAVETPFELTYEELTKLPTRTLTATLECAGNGRVNLTPAVPGLQWGQGGVGNAEWGGVPLAAILDKAGLKNSAVEVVLEGADTGQINSDPKSPGTIHFARSLPIDKAKKDEVLLAHKMNGETLPLYHGHPLRAVVGGWYGMASVKWLTRIVVTDKPFQGFFQSLDYSYFVRRDGLPTLIPVTAVQPKAVLARPGLGEVIPAGKRFRLFGAAWAGERPVNKVDVSLDGGKTWEAAKLLGDVKPVQWVLWEYVWENPARGSASIIARATDDMGNTQPPTRDPDRRTYMINHLVPTPVTIR